jgi:two-component system response regulator (stage 0 sporulation protein A)
LQVHSHFPKLVNRKIRHAIEVASGNLDPLQRFFGCTVSNTRKKPADSELIAFIAGKLKLKSSEIANFQENTQLP